jgi:tetratricopeptide (TPR) repeat protein
MARARTEKEGKSIGKAKAGAGKAARPGPKPPAQKKGKPPAKEVAKSLGRKPSPRAAAPSPKPPPKPAPPPPPDPTPDPSPAADALRELTDLADRAADRLMRFVDRVRTEAGPAAKRAADASRKMSVDLEGGLDTAWAEIQKQARDLAKAGQHTRVRIKFKDRQLVELPIAAVAAAEVASFAAFGPLRLVLGHLVGKAVLDVEFVSDADAVVAEGRELLSDGELDRALALFDKALAIDRRCAPAYLGRGIALKLRGDKPGAKAAFTEAERLDPAGESGREARRHLDNLGE